LLFTTSNRTEKSDEVSMMNHTTLVATFDTSSGHRFVLIHCGDEVCLVQANNTAPDQCTLTEFLTSPDWSGVRRPMSAQRFGVWSDALRETMDATGDARANRFKDIIGVCYEGRVNESRFVQAPIVLPWS
jgi:hypothetical protein